MTATYCHTRRPGSTANCHPVSTWANGVLAYGLAAGDWKKYRPKSNRRGEEI